MKTKHYRISLAIIAAKLEFYDELLPRGIPDPLFTELENLVRDLQRERREPCQELKRDR